MKIYQPLKCLLIVLLIFSGNKSFSQVNACITSPAADTVICRGTWINLTAANCLNPTSTNVSFSWVNLSDPAYPFGTTFSGKNLSVRDSGRWEVTVKNTLDMSTDTDTIHIAYKSEPTSPVFSINNSASFAGKCANSPVSLAATTGANITNYNWYIAGNGTSLGTASSYTVNSLPVSTDYLVSALYTTTGCILRDTIYVTNFPEPTPELGKDISICNGQSVKLIVDTLIGTYDYAWQGGAFISEDSTYTTSTSGMYKVRVKGPFPYPCIATDSVYVTVNPNPVVNAVPATLICYGNNIQLSALVAGATGPFTYSWSPNSNINNPSIQSPLVNPTANTTYTVEVTANTTGCKGTGTRIINVNPQITASVAFSDSTLCPGDSVQLQSSVAGGTGPYNFSWTPLTAISNQNTATPMVKPATSQVYKVKVKDSKNCVDSNAVAIDILWVDLPGDGDTLAILGDSIKLDASNISTNGFSFVWTDTTGATVGTSPSIYVKSSGIYTVSVYNGTCMVSDTKEVTFLFEIIQKPYVPNVFNPGLSESNNSNLRVYGNNISDENFNFRVYNQWGELVYEAKSFTEAHGSGWNGMLNNTGQALNTGVYTYVLNGQFLDGEVFEKVGTASLLR